MVISTLKNVHSKDIVLSHIGHIYIYDILYIVINTYHLFVCLFFKRWLSLKININLYVCGIPATAVFALRVLLFLRKSTVGTDIEMNCIMVLSL